LEKHASEESDPIRTYLLIASSALLCTELDKNIIVRKRIEVSNFKVSIWHHASEIKSKNERNPRRALFNLQNTVEKRVLIELNATDFYSQ